jgi:hypothetical protein
MYSLLGKRFLTSAAAVVMTLALASGAQARGPAGSGDPFDLHFDEQGNGWYSDNGGPRVNDPGFIDANGFLAYRLPETVVTGDVAINGGDEGLAVSDGLRFFARTMEFLSTGSDAFGDRGFPSDFNFSFVGATESSDNTESFLYSVGNRYFGVSGAVPEASTWAMMVIGFAGLGFAGYRRVRVATSAV